MTALSIHLKKATKAHEELLLSLGTENNPSQWIVFMNTVKEHLPFLFESGRPTKTQIENSIIGYLGFSSWSKMIAAPTESGGLAWNVNSWKLWSKAFKHVNEYPYLANMDLTANAVMTLKTMFKEEFPESLEELEQAKQDLEDSKAQNQTKTIKDLNEQVKQLQSEVLTLTSLNSEISHNYMLQSIKLENVKEELETFKKGSRLKHLLSFIRGY